MILLFCCSSITFFVIDFSKSLASIPPKTFLPDLPDWAILFTDANLT